jgi:5'-3' exonuclease
MLLIADGNNLAWAGYHALRRFQEPESAEEKIRTALHGLTQAVIGLVIRGGEPPSSGAPSRVAERNVGRTTGLVVAFDEGRPLLRRTVWPAYQTGRESDPQFATNEVHVVGAIARFMAMATMLPVTVARGVNTEADDLMAFTVLHTAGPVRVASSDRDFMQLVDDRVSIYSPIKRIVIDLASFDEQAAPKGSDGVPVAFPRERYLDYRVASGDASDDLPGLPGLGTLGAAKLLAMAPLDTYLEEPSLAARALGRQNARLSAALRSGEAAAIVARNRVLMDLRAAARRYDTIAPMSRSGTWDEPGFRRWLADQRIAGLDTDAAMTAMEGLAGQAKTAQASLWDTGPAGG